MSIHTPHVRMESSDPSKRRKKILNLIDLLSELSDDNLVEAGATSSAMLDKDLPTSLDENSSNVGAELFFKFEKHVENLDKELRSFADATRQLGSSVRILSSAFKLRERLTKILFLFRENAANLYPRKVRRQPREALPNPNFMHRQRRAPRRGRHTPVFEGFARDVVTFLNCLNEFPEFTDEAVNQSMQGFEADLKYWASCLAEYRNQFRSPAVQRYVQDLTPEISDHIDSITGALSTFTEIGVPTIRFHQQHAASNLLNLSIVATFFSAVTATTLQFSYSLTGNALADCVNAFWFSSLVFSIAAAVNSLLGFTWTQAMYRSPGHRVPWWVLIWIKQSPLVFQVMSVACFSAGLVLFTYSSGQGPVTSTIITVLTAVTSFGLAAVSAWFLSERWIFVQHKGQKWLEEVISEATNRMANTRIARTSRISVRWCSIRMAAACGYLRRLTDWIVKPKKPKDLLPIVETPQPRPRTRAPPRSPVYHQEPLSVFSIVTENSAFATERQRDETTEMRRSDARQRFVNAIRAVIMLQSTARPISPRSEPQPLSGLSSPDSPGLPLPHRTTHGTNAPPESSAPALGSGEHVPSASMRFINTVRDIQNQVASTENAQPDDAHYIAQVGFERAKVEGVRTDHRALHHELASPAEAEIDERRQLEDSIEHFETLRNKHTKEVLEFETQLQGPASEIKQVSEDLRFVKDDSDKERSTVMPLRSMVSNQSAVQLTPNTQLNVVQTEGNALQAQMDTVTSMASQQSLDHQSALRRIAFLEQEAKEEEMVRRNMVQELKGNIRVFCRVRPVLPHELAFSPTGGTPSGLSSSNSSPNAEDNAKALMADIAFPDKRDHKEIVLTSTSSSPAGQERKEVFAFSFDRVFEPEAMQVDVFAEVSLLAQSCVDGENVCIFAYGQTGSGKSFTMEGGSTEATVGMIPRAVNEVFRAADVLKSKGWEYTMEGQFLEIYNETINDLLGKGEFDKTRHEIKHEETATTTSTRVTEVNVMPIRMPHDISALLQLANSRRAVAATPMNERSSRSHSVFTLRISGCNEHTGEKCEGCLNLVDLAGSERLSSSAPAGDKEQLKETQNIDRSLSTLEDVVATLGKKGGKGEKDIPYRNSKLTYLLQYSLSERSKMLMILNLSPLAAHLNESLTSLLFATDVHNITVGPARK